jgi:hypothetical protein
MLSLCIFAFEPCGELSGELPIGNLADKVAMPREWYRYTIDNVYLRGFVYASRKMG